MELLADLCRTVEQPEQGMVRPRLPLSDMLFAAAYKVYVGFSARRFTSDLKDAHAQGLIGNAAHFNSVNREEFMAHYHKRSNIESAFSMMKGKFGDSVRSKGDTGQINEALCKVLCHNVCVLVRAIHDLGLEPTFGSRATSDSSDYLEPKLFA